MAHSVDRAGATSTPGVSLKALVVAGAVLVGYFVVTYLPATGPFAEQEFNWQGKVLSIVAGAALLAVLRLDRVSVGLVSPRRQSWGPVAVAGGMLIATGVALTAAGGGSDPNGEQLLFSSIAAPLDEELYFRGILLVLFDRVMLTSFRLRGVHLGFGALATTVVFGLGHGLVYSSDGALLVDPVNIVWTGVMALVLVWIRIRSGSLVPAVLTHGLLNGAMVITGLLAA